MVKQGTWPPSTEFQSENPLMKMDLVSLSYSKFEAKDLRWTATI